MSKKPAPELFESSFPIGIDESTVSIYCPRKDMGYEHDLQDMVSDIGCTVEELCEWTAQHLENLALQFREFGADKRKIVYRANLDIEKYHERLAAMELHRARESAKDE